MHVTAEDAVADRSEDGWPSTGSATYLILILTVANIFSYVDRIIINLMIDPIKSDLRISDTQVALLQGLAFGLFYTIAALPIGRLVDLMSRRVVLAAGAAVFSVFTIASGMAQNFVQLFLARVGVGTGEATLHPSAYSLLADTFPQARLGRAMGIYTMGSFAGIGAAYMLGGTLVQWAHDHGEVQVPVLGNVRPWQAVLLMIGALSLIAAACLWTLREPPRRGSAAKQAAPSVGAVVRFARDRWQLFALMFGGWGMVNLCAHAGNSWTPAMLGRVYGLTPAEIGLTMGTITLLCSTSGVVAGGFVGDWLTRRGRLDGPVVGAMIGAGCAWIPGTLAPLMPNRELLFLCIALRDFFFVFTFPLGATAITLLTPNRYRGQISALYLFVINVVGLGIGPTVVGLMNDHVFPTQQGVRYALSWTYGLAMPTGVLLMFVAARFYRRERLKQLAG